MGCDRKGYIVGIVGVGKVAIRSSEQTFPRIFFLLVLFLEMLEELQHLYHPSFWQHDISLRFPLCNVFGKTVHAVKILIVKFSPFLILTLPGS